MMSNALNPEHLLRCFYFFENMHVKVVKLVVQQEKYQHKQKKMKILKQISISNHIWHIDYMIVYPEIHMPARK